MSVGWTLLLGFWGCCSADTEGPGSVVASADGDANGRDLTTATEGDTIVEGPVVVRGRMDCRTGPGEGSVVSGSDAFGLRR